MKWRLLVVVALLLSIFPAVVNDRSFAQEENPHQSTYLGNPGRSGVMDGPGPDPAHGVEVKWAQADGPISPSPVVDGDLVFAGSWTGEFGAFDLETGESVWTASLLADGEELPFESRWYATVADDVVYVSGSNRNLYAFDRETGVESWRFTASSELSSASAVSEDYVLVSSIDGTLFAIAKATGLEAWRVITPISILGAPSIAGELAIIAGGDGVVRAIDIALGLEEWTFPESGAGNLDTPSAPTSFSLSPVISEDVVFVAEATGVIYALDIESGSELWSARFSDHVTSLVALDDLLIASHFDGNVVALDIADGSERWRHWTGTLIPYAAMAANGVIYVPATDTIYALNAISGELEWTYFAGRISSPVVVSDDTLLVGTDADGIVALVALAPTLEIGASAVITSETNLLGAPTSSGLVRAELEEGDSVTVSGASVTDSSEEWWPVTDDETGLPGWIPASAIEPIWAPTPSPTPSPSPTATPIPTSTMTPIPTATSTLVPTATMVPTNTPVPTATLVPTSTPLPTATSTPEPTATPTDTPTPEPTSTPTNTSTPAPTSTPTPPPTPTVIPTPTATPTPPPAPGSVIYEADWSEGFGGWTSDEVGWRTVGGVLIFDGSEASQILAPASATRGLRNYSIDSTVMIVDCSWPSPFQTMSLVGRLSNDNRAVRGGLMDIRDSRWFGGANVGERVDADEVRFDVPLIGWVNVRLEVMGDEYYLSVNGLLVDYGTDSSLLDGESGRAGLHGGQGCKFQVSSFRIFATGFGNDSPASDFGGDASVVYSLLPGADTSTWRLRGAVSLGTSVQIADGFVVLPYSPGFLSSFAIEADFRFEEIAGTCAQNGGFRFGIQLFLDAGGTWAGFVRDELCDGSTEAALVTFGESNWDEPAGQRGLGTDGNWHRFRIEVENTAIRFYHDGNLVGETTDSRLPSVITPYFEVWEAVAEIRNVRILSPADAFAASGPAGSDRGATGGGTIDVTESNTGSSAIADMIPAPEAFDAAFALSASDKGSRNDIANTFSSQDTGLENLASWDWKGSVFAHYDNSGAGESDTNRVEIEIHRFGEDEGAAAALPAFANAHATKFGLFAISIPELGDQVQGVSGRTGDQNEVTIYVRVGPVLIVVTAYSADGDPAQTALDAARAIVGP